MQPVNGLAILPMKWMDRSRRQKRASQMIHVHHSQDQQTLLKQKSLLMDTLQTSSLKSREESGAYPQVNP